ncbi:MAG: nucleoside hydrolase [Comamonadaceae bacterium]|nr:nucleoside hydrolase [Comamonadaceae bacterium]
MIPRPVVLDCDPGHDDALAITLALARPELQVLGDHHGRRQLAARQHDPQRAARAGAAGPDRTCPVAPGAERPLLRESWIAGRVPRRERPRRGRPPGAGGGAPAGGGPGADGGARGGPPGARSRSWRPGPLTNVALLLRARPRIREGIERICLMGGSLGEGNTTRGGGVQHLAGPRGGGDRLRERDPDLDDGPRRHSPGALPGARRGAPRGARHADRPDLGRPPALLRRLPPPPLRLGRLADPRRRGGGPPGRAGPRHDRAAARGRGDRRRADPWPDGGRPGGPAWACRRTSRPASTSTGRASSTSSWRRSRRSAEDRRGRAGPGRARPQRPSSRSPRFSSSRRASEMPRWWASSWRSVSSTPATSAAGSR